MLQFGRALSGAETGRPRVRALPIPASIRPRPLRRGDFQSGQGVVPSTKPLQFGRALSGAETFATMADDQQLTKLQFGRALSGAETRGRPAGRVEAPASIRPRPLRRGDWTPSGSITIGTVLQFGRALSGAETRGRLLTTGFGVAASIRPRPLRRGDDVAHSRHVQRYPASIRPRPLRRGDHRGDLRSVDWSAASIRPRPLRRGDGGTSSAFRRRLGLQFGRALSGAETSSDEPYVDFEDLLQFGRALSGAETVIQ